MSTEETLKEPVTERGRCVRLLAEAAMSVTNHDINETEPEYIHEVQAMERRFSKVLRRFGR